MMAPVRRWRHYTDASNLWLGLPRFPSLLQGIRIAHEDSR
jgi:hypothetical protein